jgi:hypothetical protein
MFVPSVVSFGFELTRSHARRENSLSASGRPEVNDILREKIGT